MACKMAQTSNPCNISQSVTRNQCHATKSLLMCSPGHAKRCIALRCDAILPAFPDTSAPSEFPMLSTFVRIPTTMTADHSLVRCMPSRTTRDNIDGARGSGRECVAAVEMRSPSLCDFKPRSSRATVAPQTSGTVDPRPPMWFLCSYSSNVQFSRGL